MSHHEPSFRDLLHSLLSGPGKEPFDDVTRALHVLDTLCVVVPDSVQSHADCERDHAEEFADPASEIYDEHFATLHACTALLMRSMLASVRAGLGVPREAKERFKRGGEES